MDIGRYLERIGAEPPIALTVEALENLQRRHLTAVPFENLDVFHRRGVGTDPSWSIPKVVDRGRGGWCYEINGAFATLLEELGFTVKWLGAGVLPINGPFPDHLTIEVSLDRPYLVDVGYGDSFIRPLPLDSEGPHDGGSGTYWFDFDGTKTALISDDAGGRKRQYVFDRAKSFEPADFEPSSNRLQTDESLKWLQGPFATRLLDDGPDRVTLLRDRIKFRRNGVTTEQAVAPGNEWDQALAEWFGLTP